MHVRIIPNERTHYHTKSTSVAALFDEPTPLFDNLLKLATGDDPEMIAYLWRTFGYWTTKSTKEQVAFFWYGPGGNGKTTIANTVRRIMGSYAVTAAINTFFQSRSERHSQELAVLRGSRLVIASEPNKNQTWDETKIKLLTGGENIRANLMYHNSTEYKPGYKILIVGNNKPRLDNVDEAMRRRFHVVPFNQIISDAERIKDYEERLVPEHPAILGKMLRGCENWFEFGLMPPVKVTEETTQYFDDQDLIRQWIEEEGEIRLLPGATMTSPQVFAAWQKFATARGEQPGNMQTLVETMKKSRFLMDRGVYYTKYPARGFRGLAGPPEPSFQDRT